MKPSKLCEKKYEKLKNDPWYCSFCENQMLFSKMSNNDIRKPDRG